MSEPTLYRFRSMDEPVDFDSDEFVSGAWMRPVEPCKHGFYVGHPVEVDGWTAHNEWCPGAGIGDTEPECEHPVVRTDDYCESCDDYMGEGAWKRAAGIGGDDDE